MKNDINLCGVYMVYIGLKTNERLDVIYRKEAEAALNEPELVCEVGKGIVATQSECLALGELSKPYQEQS